MASHTIGTNVTVTVTGTKATIEIDLSQTHGTSSTGKSIIVATTNGNQLIPGTADIRIGLNVYKPKR